MSYSQKTKTENRNYVVTNAIKTVKMVHIKKKKKKKTKRKEEGNRKHFKEMKSLSKSIEARKWMGF